MKSLLKALVLLFCVTALPLISFAQDTPTQTVDLGDNYSIIVPADWQVTKNHDGAFTLENDTITLAVTTPTRLNALNFTFAAHSNVVDVLLALALPFSGVQPHFNTVQKARYDNRVAAVYVNSASSTFDQMIVVLSLSDGSFGYLSLITWKGQLTALNTEIGDIIASFNGHRAAGTTSAASISVTPPAATTSCTVSIDSANTAQLRVGPGTNRGAISFLPANTSVSVTGRIALTDGAIWYQLDKSQAAPKGTAAAELWVAAADVTASGDCEHVGDTSAPPVIPGLSVPPTAIPGASNGDTNPSASPGLLPRAGTWVFNINATINGSCAGGPNVPLPATQIYDTLNYTFALTNVSQNSFTYGGEVFTRYPGSNSFNGAFSIDNLNAMQLRFDVLSPTSMRGEINGNLTADGGISCNVTVLFATDHR